MYMSYFAPSKTYGNIEMNQPIHRLGKHTDIHGNVWDVNAIIGGYVCAVPLEELHPYYKSTDTFTNYGFIHQTWYPYRVKLNGEYRNF